MIHGQTKIKFIDKGTWRRTECLRREHQVLEDNVPKCHCGEHKSKLYFPGIEPVTSVRYFC